MAANWILDEQILKTAEAMPNRHLVACRDHMVVLIGNYVSKSCVNTGNLIIAQTVFPRSPFPFPRPGLKASTIITRITYKVKGHLFWRYTNYIEV